MSDAAEALCAAPGGVGEAAPRSAAAPAGNAVPRVDEVRARLDRPPRGTASLDPRVKLALVVGTSTLCLVSGGEVTVLALLAAAAVLASTGGGARMAVRFVAGYLALNAVIALTGLLHVPGLSAIVVVLGFTLLKFVPVFLLACWFVGSTRTGELIAALERMRAPRAVTIPLAVTMRYLPTLGLEFGCIRDTMRMRGIDCSVAGIVRRPVALLEYVMVPLLMRCVKVADELAAAAVSRGIEHEGVRSCVRDVRLRARDGVAIALFFLFAVAIVAIDQSALGNVAVWEVRI